MTAAVLAFAVLLAAANGSNDDPKGVATLGGAGVARYRHALTWGVAATLAGSLLSLQLASGLTELFSTGIVTAPPTPAFALAVLVGTTAWVALASATRLPVSTTHALVGALLGGGLVLGPETVAWAALVPRVVEPLLISIVLAYVASALLNAVPRSVPECVCVEAADAVVVPATVSRSALVFPTTTLALPVVRTGTIADCRAHGATRRRGGLTINGIHWLSAGAASFARGLNDTPKIVAIAAFALVPAGLRPSQLVAIVATAMAAGGVIGGLRVARRLGDDITAMDHVKGAKANLTAAALVGLGATRGLPISLTHVSAGAIAGTSASRPSRLNHRSLRDFALAWTVTPIVAGAVAGACFLLIR